MLAVSYEEDTSKKEKTPIKGIIIRSRSKEFTVLSNGQEYLCVARGNLKIKDKKIITGDKVEFSDGVITEISPRKVEIGRPKVANVDVVNIVIASTPTPDYLLVDKMIIDCVRLGISVYLTVNKCDVTTDTKDYVLKNYKNAVDKIFCVSAETSEGVSELVEASKGKLCCLAGQSAVGKTSLCNLIFGKTNSVNTVSDKTDRGRHTTTSREIHYTDSLFIVDTPGFSAFDIENVDSCELMNYYKDFEPYNGKCYFIGCMHVSEPDCLVKNAVEKGIVSNERYKRYLSIYREVKEYEKRKY